MKPNNYTLGIDMGVASIGWGIVSITDKFIDSGVRVFPAGVDAINSAKEKHPNLDRRSARGMRRRIRRKAKRKALVRSILQGLGWMPEGEIELQDWHNLNVYELRSRAISEKITLAELGRIILHLNQRRGFLSLRKTEETEADKETKGMLGEISALQKNINESESRTLGNYLYRIYKNEGIKTRIRARHVRRSMLHDEFSLIWETQAKHHPELTEALRYGTTGKLENPTKVVTPKKRVRGESILEQFGIENITFFQRRVYWPESSIGSCELEPDEKRAATADRRFQEFRMLQEVNNLKILDDSTPGRPTERVLSATERNITIKYLTGKDKASFDQLRKQLSKLPNSPEAAQISFNLESGGRKVISATPTDSKLVSSKGYGKDWGKLSSKTKNQVVGILTNPTYVDDDIRGALEKISEIPPDKIECLLKVSLPAGYCHLSVKALEKLLPFMRKGMLYMAKDGSDSAMHAAGYQRRDEESHSTLGLLPSFQLLLDPNSKYYDPHQVQINNPVVLRSLTELRKVVNGLIRKFGKPSRIHLEMARDLKMSPKQRAEHQKQNREFEKERDQAAKKLTKENIIPNRDAINLYRLWKEQKEVCIYSGKTIGFTQLFGGGGEIDVDHIYPFTDSADDSLANKVICFRESNANKGNRLPYTWLANSDPDRYEEILQRAKKLPRGKYKRFIAEEIPEGFVNRDLNDTAWMARSARQYLARIMDKPHHILGIKGRHTATLRNQWELHSLLRNDGIDLKNRDDHRHHALDAIVIALCNQSRIQEISRKLKHELRVKEATEEGKRIYHLRTTGDRLELPWKSFRLEVTKSLNSIWVSHRPKRKVSGSLHQETNYGSTSEAGVLVRRKNLSKLTEGEVAKIRDGSIAQIVRKYINGNKILYREDFGEKFSKEISEVFGNRDSITEEDIDNIEDEILRKSLLSKLTKKNPLQDSEYGKITFPSGIAIKKVRLLIPNKAAVVLRSRQPRELVIPGNTHHLVIFSLGEGKCHFEPVTMLEASRRKREGKPIVCKIPPDEHPEAEYMMHLCSGDSMMAEIEGSDRLFIFNGVHAIDLTGKFLHHTDATRDHRDPDIDRKKEEYKQTLDAFRNGEIDKIPLKPIASLKIFCKPSTFEKVFPKARKVNVLPHGEIRNIDG